jgi:hypothetical protein
MATTVQVHVGDAVDRKRATSRVAGNFRNHPTLWVGILYAITIIVVLAFVARFQ